MELFSIRIQRTFQLVSTMKKPFGEQTVTKTFSTLGERNLNLRESGALKMAIGTGILSSVGSVTAATHNFHGND